MINPIRLMKVISKTYWMYLEGNNVILFYLKEPVNENSPHLLIDVRLMVHISGRNTATNLLKLTIIKGNSSQWLKLNNFYCLVPNPFVLDAPRWSIHNISVLILIWFSFSIAMEESLPQFSCNKHICHQHIQQLLVDFPNLCCRYPEWGPQQLPVHQRPADIRIQCIALHWDYILAINFTFKPPKFHQLVTKIC